MAQVLTDLRAGSDVAPATEIEALLEQYRQDVESLSRMRRFASIGPVEGQKCHSDGEEMRCATTELPPPIPAAPTVHTPASAQKNRIMMPSERTVDETTIHTLQKSAKDRLRELKARNILSNV